MEMSASIGGWIQESVSETNTELKYRKMTLAE